MYVQNVSVCTSNTSTCVNTGTFCSYTRGDHRQFCLPKFVHVGLSRAPEVQQRSPCMLPTFSLRIGREEHVRDSSNCSLYLIKLFKLQTHDTTTQTDTHTHNTATHNNTAQNTPQHRSKEKRRRDERDEERHR